MTLLERIFKKKRAKQSDIVDVARLGGGLGDEAQPVRKREVAKQDKALNLPVAKPAVTVSMKGESEVTPEVIDRVLQIALGEETPAARTRRLIRAGLDMASQSQKIKGE